MGRQLVVGVLAGVAYVSAYAGTPATPHGPARRGGKFAESDSRRASPGTHRAGPNELAVRNRVARAEADKIADRARLRAHAVAPRAASVAASTWVSLGPTGAFNEFNGVDIDGVDSGRLNAVVIDPRDANVVYVAASGGGVWKTFNFLTGSQTAAGPRWSPLSDNLPNLAIGALAIDADAPDTLYLGTGDFTDGAGNTVQKTIDGGATWGAPVVLSGTYPAPNGFTANVGAIRALAVRDQLVLAGTDVGLFASTDAGASFALVDLPNINSQLLIDSVWSVVATGGGHWVASGLTSCDPASGPPPLQFGVDAGPGCTNGNNGEIWTSADGHTWQLATLPAGPTPGAPFPSGRVTLAAGPTTNPATTVVYAYVGSTDGTSTAGFWRSSDAGHTWVDATGTLANPTLPLPGSTPDCGDTDFGHTQTWYNQMIVVDPTNADHVLVGGNFCGARTLDGTAASPTWELVSHWLPAFASGNTANGSLPYVHADWHAGASVVIDGAVRTFAGTDGGVFSSTNLFSPTTPPGAVDWKHHNRGLVTHELYAIGSGDPATGNPFVLFGGLQDNGTRFRVNPAQPSVFNQPIGGDGIGASVHVSTAGTTYWGSVEFSRLFCQPSATVDCADGNHWFTLDPGINPDPEAEEEAAEARARAGRNGPEGEDSEPFFIHYANVETDTTGQSTLTHSNNQVFVAVSQPDPNNPLAWLPLSQDFTAQGTGIANVSASRATPGVYGAAGLVSLQPFYITTLGNTPTDWTIAQPIHPTGTAARLTGASSIDFPTVLPTGTQPGQVFIGAFTNTLNDAARTPPPDDQGRLYRTTDFGQTWTSIVGADPARRLPNVAVYVVKYDPITPTTIYAGTDLGVYLTTDDGAHWDRMGEGLPIVPVRDIYIAKNQDFIRIATFGRGMWEIYPSATANQGAPGNGDYDRNLRYDWIDLAAMASRLGTTPATTAPPLYTWIDDITSATGPTGPEQQIDDVDLAALLASFGGQP
jgi:hypothetical protein